MKNTKNLEKYKLYRVSNLRPLALLTTCLTSLPTQHYVFMFQVLFFEYFIVHLKLIK
jgi:hypothetical protein